MMFTNMQIGKPIPTSTNSGHVLFIGLGQLPGNKWGITPHDKDPVKTSLLIKSLVISINILIMKLGMASMKINI